MISSCFLTQLDKKIAEITLHVNIWFRSVKLAHATLKQKVHIRANDKVGSALVMITIVDKKVPVDFLASLSYQDVSGWQHLQAPGLANSR